MLESAKADAENHLRRYFMQIGQIIRKNRKEKNMTQEEMANYLGVTAPAVNKWENGASYPDIMLLAPIARLLGITVDALLSFQEELTAEEIGVIVRELDSMLKEKTYEEAFAWAREKLRLYPNCGQLFWQLALILDVHRLTKDVEAAGRYEEFIIQWYNRALESGEEEARIKAADSLFAYYERKGQYEKAEEYLAYFSDQSPEKKRKQASLYSKTGRRDEAYKAYEELLFSNYQTARMLFYGIFTLVVEDENMDKARLLAEKQEELARVYDMGVYNEVLGKLELAVTEKDADTAIDNIDRMLASVESIADYTKSPLYEHMTFRALSREFTEQTRSSLLEYIREDESLEFLKDGGGWEKLEEKYKELVCKK